MKRTVYGLAVVAAVLVGMHVGPGSVSRKASDWRGNAYGIPCNAWMARGLPCSGCWDSVLYGWIGCYATIRFLVYPTSPLQCPASDGCTTQYQAASKDYLCDPCHW